LEELHEMTFTESFIDGIGLLKTTVPDLIMILIAFVLLYLAIVKKYESLLLLPIAFGMLIANIPITGLSAYDEGGLLYFLYQGIKLGIYPPMIFLCLGALTDFGPLIAQPRSALIGIGGQLGIFTALGIALLMGPLFGSVIPGFEGFTIQEAAVIGIIGSSDGPTTIYCANNLAPHILPSVAIAAYSYMALVPIIQPPIMRALTTAKERVVVMPKQEAVTKKQKIFFPLIITVVTLFLVPAAAALIAMMMLGNLMRECGVVDRYMDTLQVHLLNILTILIGICIGSTATGGTFLTPQTLMIVVLGLLAFCFGTVGGVLMAKLLYLTTGGKVNPLIGNSGVSAMPMAARVSQKLGQEYNKKNHLIYHAMGPIVASTIGSAIVAGIFISLFGG
jgi:oxaloacetate decarboxylase beta subunit